MDYAISRGINFIDTAEMYPAPMVDPRWKPGRTEEIIGTYLAKNPGVREKLIIATKIIGQSNPSSAIVENRIAGQVSEPGKFPTRQDKESLLAACDASLRRLQTPYIDLYQLHTPDRYVPIFGSREYVQESEYKAVSFREILEGLKVLLDQGKIRAYGLSKESTFGVCQFCSIADEMGMPRPVTIQNEFGLLDRAFEFELAEACAPCNYNIGLLPWSILGAGVLSGKYNGRVDKNCVATDESLANARLSKYPHFQPRFLNELVLEAVEEYKQLAEAKGMTTATLAQAFCKSRWYIPSSIIGATSMEQLKENIDAFEVELSKDVLQKIDDIHNKRKDIALSV